MRVMVPTTDLVMLLKANMQEVDNISETLYRMGNQKHGYKIICNDHIGRRLTNMILLGPIYYQRLNYMVDDRIHSRGRGPMQILTR
ncbi:hypothetical protein LguiA_001670 [Lonicera macranthoides]